MPYSLLLGGSETLYNYWSHFSSRMILKSSSQLERSWFRGNLNGPAHYRCKMKPHTAQTGLEFAVCYRAGDGLEILTFCPTSRAENRGMDPHPPTPLLWIEIWTPFLVYVVLEIEPSSLCMLGKLPAEPHPQPWPGLDSMLLKVLYYDSL